VTKTRAVVLSIVFGLGLCIAPVGLARTSFAQNVTPANQAKTRKAYLKEQKKQQKKIKKAEQKAQKKNRALHPAES
jgi:hypothetical protein